MLRLALVVTSFVAFAGCKEVDPAFCQNPDNANEPTCKIGGPCTANSNCTSTPTFAVCDLTDNGGTCVQCTADDHAFCMGLAPHCEDHACVACVDDSDCGAKGVGVCMPTGGCADTSSIIHAISTGGSNTSTCGAMGNACTLDTAITLAKAGRNVIKLDDANIYTSEIDGLIVDNDVAIGLTIDARGAVLHRNNDGPILTIISGKGVTILGGTIEGANGGGGDGIRCDSSATLIIDGTTIATNEESAIDASGCTLTVRNATIRGNSKLSSGPLFPGIQFTSGSATMSRSTITSNRGGGIVVNNGKFEIVGNVFLSNGDGAGVIGGVSVISTILGNRLEFNTITQNRSDAAYAAGVQCSSPGNPIAQNNIIWNNNSLLSPPSIQVSGGCIHAYSDIGPALVPPGNDGSHNLSGDPSFANDMTDLHLKAGTMVRGKANPGADLTGIASKDMAGRLRVSPADIGAYQAPAQ